MGIMDLIAGPAGTLVTGGARNFFQTLRQKRANRVNRGIDQDMMRYTQQFYGDAVPMVDRATNQMRGGFFDPAQRRGGSMAVPGQPTPGQPIPGQFAGPTGGKPSGVVKARQDPNAAGGGQPGGFVTTSGAVRNPTERTPVAPGTPPNYGQAAVDEWQAREDKLVGEQKANEAALAAGYKDRYDRGIKNLEGAGAQAGKDIDKEYADEEARIRSDSEARGITGSTVLSNLVTGNAAERINEQGRLTETLRRERSDLDKELSGDQLKSMSKEGEFGNIFGSQLSGDTAQEVSGQGKEFREADRFALASQLGIRKEALDMILNLMGGQKQEGPGIAPVLDAVPAASAAYNTRQAANAAANQGGNFGFQLPFGLGGFNTGPGGTSVNALGASYGGGGGGGYGGYNPYGSPLWNPWMRGSGPGGTPPINPGYMNQQNGYTW